MYLPERIHNLPHLIRLRGHYGISTKEAEKEIRALVEEAIREDRVFGVRPPEKVAGMEPGHFGAF